ncbi:MAG: hypothetical protein IK003_06370 [Prevotella sp.]|nr:hypothetical protein [Prevotella sp.]
MKYKILVILCIGILLWFVIQPVEQSWSETDTRLIKTICAISAVALIIFFLQKQLITISTIDVIVLLWFGYVMIRAGVDTTYPCASFCLRTMQMLALYFLLRLLLSSTNPSENIIVIGILLCGFYEVIIGGLQLVNGTSRHNYYALTGTFQNPGPYSAILSMGLVMACQAKKPYWVPLIFAILLPATWSRAALLSTAICLAIIYWEQWKQWRWWVAAGILCMAAALYFLKQGSADGRSIIYLISLLNISHSPIWGSGIGSFFHQYAEGLAQFCQQHPTFNAESTDVLMSAFNEFLYIGVEQGVIGLTFATAMIIMLSLQLKKKGKALGIGLLSLLIFSLFSYPFEQLPYQILFVVIAAYGATNKGYSETVLVRNRLFKRFLIPIGAFCCILLLSGFAHHHITIRAKADNDYWTTAGIKHSALINAHYEILPLLRDNPYFLFDFGKTLSENGRYTDSNAILRLGTLISNDPMYYVIQGNNYVQMKLYDEAEGAYQKAFSIMPNRIYPLYRLMLLYEKRGDLTKEKETAQRVISFKEKVVSPATKEMKDKAYTILKKLNKE